MADPASSGQTQTWPPLPAQPDGKGTAGRAFWFLVAALVLVGGVGAGVSEVVAVCRFAGRQSNALSLAAIAGIALTGTLAWAAVSWRHGRSPVRPDHWRRSRAVRI